MLTAVESRSTLSPAVSQTSRQSTDKWSQVLAKAHAAQNALADVDCKQADCEEAAEKGLELLFERFVIFPVNSLTFFNPIASVCLLDKVGSLEDWGDDCLEMKVDDSIVRVLSLKVIEMFRSMFLTLITNAIYFCEAFKVYLQ